MILGLCEFIKMCGKKSIKYLIFSFGLLHNIIDPHSTWESNGWFQYFLYSSFVFNTTATFPDIPLMKSTQKSFGIRTNSVTIPTYSSRMPRGTVSCPVNFFFKCCHKFSIGLRSGDCTDHSRTSTILVSSHFRAILEVCFGSLSCWKMVSLMSSS